MKYITALLLATNAGATIWVCLWLDALARGVWI